MPITISLRGKVAETVQAMKHSPLSLNTVQNFITFH